MDALDGRPVAVLVSLATIVPVREVRRAIEFYQRLGFVAEVYGDAGDAAEYAFLIRDGQQLHLRLAQDLPEGSESPAGMYLYVQDADVMYEELRAAGVTALGEPEDKPWRMREFAVSDPDGTLLRFGMPISH